MLHIGHEYHYMTMNIIDGIKVSLGAFVGDESH